MIYLAEMTMGSISTAIEIELNRLSFPFRFGIFLIPAAV